jgi:hypothetical protein
MVASPAVLDSIEGIVNDDRTKITYVFRWHYVATPTVNTETTFSDWDIEDGLDPIGDVWSSGPTAADVEFV